MLTKARPALPGPVALSSPSAGCDRALEAGLASIPGVMAAGHAGSCGLGPEPLQDCQAVPTSLCCRVWRGGLVKLARPSPFFSPLVLWLNRLS